MIKKSNCKYPNYVNKIECFAIHNLRVRFLLTIETNCAQNRSILVVMKNPSKANQFQSDKTINNVIKNLYLQYNKIYIANLFPYYSTKANGLLAYFDDDNQTIQFFNKLIIQKYSLMVNDILIGWGTNTIGMKQKDYDSIIYEIMQILQKSRKNLYYVHCCKCSIRGCKVKQPQCKLRCNRNCKRTNRNNQIACPTVRYPMHLELWEGGKNMQQY